MGSEFELLQEPDTEQYVSASVRQILVHLGEPTSPPRLAPARGPPLWEMPDAGKDRFDPHAQPAPDYEFDQRIAW
jgi:hypothetical protein